MIGLVYELVNVLWMIMIGRMIGRMVNVLVGMEELGIGKCVLIIIMNVDVFSDVLAIYQMEI